MNGESACQYTTPVNYYKSAEVTSLPSSSSQGQAQQGSQTRPGTDASQGTHTASLVPTCSGTSDTV
ncbi:hypothetical protein E2C01_027493 [Portunus trituberculatus]|uniref:Uncharacterized protein n=1 Tax=Portunus trituberculatus TaxID=210409 RepID=A0A5B7ENV3_PORTR|nr:hypothetical protein [Portunus trituberculatus]